MSEYAVRDLRNNTAALLRRVEAGEEVVITVRGKPVADLVPHRDTVRHWWNRSELLDMLLNHAADAGLRDDLKLISEETTDDLGPIE